MLKSSSLILASILTLAFILRIVGIDYGLPQFLVGDEQGLLGAAFKMGEELTFRPNFGFYYHQPFLAQIFAIVFGLVSAGGLAAGIFESLGELRELVILQAANFLVVTRFVVAVFGALTVWALYVVGKKMFSRSVGLVAALLLAVNLMHVQMSHWGRVWIPMIFFLVLTLFYSYKIFERGRLRDYVFAALTLLLAVGIHGPGGLGYLFVLVGHTLSSRAKRSEVERSHNWNDSRGEISPQGRNDIKNSLSSERGVAESKNNDLILRLRSGIKSLFSKNFIIFNIIFLSGLALIVWLNPFGATKFFTILSGTDPTLAKDFIVWPERLWYMFQILLEYMPVILVVGILGLVALFKKHWRRGLIVTSFIFIYYIFAGPATGLGEPRTFLPIIPFLALAAAFVIDRFVIVMFKQKVNQTLALFVFTIVLAAYSGYLSFSLSSDLSQRDTRLQAIDWLDANARPNAGVLLKLGNVDLNENLQSIELLEEINPFWLNTKRRYLLDNPEKIPEPAYFSWDLNHTPTGDLPDNFFDTHEFNYLLIERWNEARQIPEKITETYELNLVQTFSPGDDPEFPITDIAANMRRPFTTLNILERGGPHVEIYKLRKDRVIARSL